MDCPRWTPEEESFFRRTYSTKGLDYVVKNLDRTRGAVRSRAYRHGLTNQIPKSYVKLAWVDPGPNGGTHRQAVQAAREAGVLRFAQQSGVKVAIAPESWADEYATRLARKVATERETRWWWTAADIADRTGLKANSISALYKSGTSVGRYLRSVETVLVDRPRKQWRWHPHQAKTAIARWKASQ